MQCGNRSNCNARAANSRYRKSRGKFEKNKSSQKQIIDGRLQLFLLIDSKWRQKSASD